MDNIEREFSYKVSCVETSCDWTFNLCQVIDVRMYVLVINHCIGLHGRLRSGERDMYDETHGIIAQLPTDE